MKREELTKTFIIISNWKKFECSSCFTHKYFRVVRVNKCSCAPWKCLNVGICAMCEPWMLVFQILGYSNYYHDYWGVWSDSNIRLWYVCMYVCMRLNISHIAECSPPGENRRGRWRSGVLSPSKAISFWQQPVEGERPRWNEAAKTQRKW